MKENKIAGVYKITNTITGDFYIGSSKDIKLRWSIHKTPYTIKQHSNVKLYKAMAQYGRDNFTIEVIEKTNNLREREQYWIEYLKPVYNDRYADGYNTERKKESIRRGSRKYHRTHQRSAETIAKNKAYRSRLCLYNGETLTLNALTLRLRRQGIVNPMLEAKKYLMTGRDLSAEELSKLALSK